MDSRRGRRARTIATQDRDHDMGVLGMRLREPAEIAELCAAERLDASARRQRDFREIGIMGAGVGGAMKRLVDLVKSLRIAAADEYAKLLVRRFEAVPFRRR